VKIFKIGQYFGEDIDKILRLTFGPPCISIYIYLQQQQRLIKTKTWNQ